MLIGIYIRVSTDEQASEGYSLAEQERQCRAYCAAHGWADARVYADEGMSAFKDQLAARPALARLLEDVRAKRIGGVVVHKLDRFFRRAKLLIATVEELIDVLKVPFVSVSEQIDFSTPAGRVMLANLGGFAEYYSRNLSIETKKGLAGKARAGDWIGPVPFGYVRDGKTLTPSADAWIVQAIYAAYASGAESYTSIAQDLNARGLRMHHWRDGDRPFGRESIRSILGNPAYRGQVSCKGIIADGRHPPLIDADLWGQCARIRADRFATTNTPGIRGAGGMLTELAYCAICGARLWYHRSGSNAHYYYRCGKRREYGEDGCPSRMMAAGRMDGAVLDLVRVLRLPPDVQQQVLARAYELLQPRQQTQAIDPAKVRRQLERLRAVYLAGDEELSDAIYFAERRRLEALQQTPEPFVPQVLDLERAFGLLNDMAGAIETMQDGERRRVIRALFVRVWLSYSSGITRFTPAPAYAVLVEAAARVIEGCPTGDRHASITVPPRIYTV